MTDIDTLSGIRTPFYLYDMGLLGRTADAAASAARRYGIELHYATKANENQRIIRLLAGKGFGADCVSGGEIELALSCGIPADKVVFAGVGKGDGEILAALEAGVACFNCESVQELYIINAIARQYGFTANVCMRVNPNIDAHTFKYITSGLHVNKFGVSAGEFEDFATMLGKCTNVHFSGIHFHIGSQITDVENVFRTICGNAAETIGWFESKGFEVENVNLGGGLGVNYEDPDSGSVPDFDRWLGTIDRYLPRRPGMRVHLEPGRSLVAQCGTLVSRLLFVKETEAKTFLVLDAGMNNLVRPAFYGAYHKIENLSAALRPAIPADQVYDIVGPVCESSDTWGKDRRLPLSVRGDLFAIRSAGAYGEAMSNSYNLRDSAQVVYSDCPQQAQPYKGIL